MKIRFLKLFSKSKYSHILLWTNKTLFDIDSPIFIGCAQYSIMKDFLLQMRMSVVEFTTLKLFQGALTAKILGCHFWIFGITSIFTTILTFYLTLKFLYFSKGTWMIILSVKPNNIPW